MNKILNFKNDKNKFIENIQDLKQENLNIN